MIRVWRAIVLVARYLVDMAVANIVVAFEVLTPRSYMRPGIIRVPIRTRDDMLITLLANMITMTPGTVALEVSEEKDAIYVHGLHIVSPAHLRLQIQTLEDRLMKVFR